MLQNSCQTGRLEVIHGSLSASYTQPQHKINKYYSFLTASALYLDSNCCAQRKTNPVVLHVSHAKRIALQRKGKTNLACFLHTTEVPFSQALPEATITNKALWERWKWENHKQKINGHIHFITITQTVGLETWLTHFPYLLSHFALAQWFRIHVKEHWSK